MTTGSAAARVPESSSAPSSGRKLRIIPEIVLLAVEEGVLVDGLAHREMICGPIAQTVLPDVIDQLRGEGCTLAELTSAVPGIPEDYLHTAVSLLSEWGLLAADQGPSKPDGVNANTLAFLSRCIVSSGLQRSAAESYGRIQRTNVILMIDERSGDLGHDVTSLLLQTGFGSVTPMGPKDDLWPAHLSPNTCGVALSIGEDAGKWELLDKLRIEKGFSWLRVAIHPELGYLDIGPVFRAEEASCYRCFRRTHCAFEHAPPALSRAASRFCAGIIVTELTHLFAVPELCPAAREFRRFEIENGSFRSLAYSRIPGCSLCWNHVDPLLRSDGPEAAATDTALVYEQYVGLESRRFIEPGASEQVAATTQRLSREFRSFENCERVPLSRRDLRLPVGGLEVLRQRAPASKHLLSCDHIAAVLALIGGIKQASPDSVKRWCATAGNLGSVELFLAARNVAGLQEGIYFYQPGEHSLARLSKRGALQASELMSRILKRRERALPAALVFLTAVFERVACKYGSFGYRLIHLDAGVALSQFHFAARSMDLRSSTVTQWADALLEDQLDLRAGNQRVTAVVELGGKPAAASWAPAFRGRSLSPPASVASCKPAHEFSGLAEEQVTQLLFRESRFEDGNSAWTGARALRQPGKPGSGTARPIALPDAPRGGVLVADILSKRESVRIYDEARSVPAECVSAMLQYACHAEASERQCNRRNPLLLSYTVSAQNVKGIDAGVYDYDARDHALVPRRGLMTREQMSTLFVQPEFAPAPLFIWITGNLAAACASEGAAGHRRLLVRAGAAAHRLWMAALSVNLAGCIVAGLIPGAARGLLGFDGYRDAILAGLACGYPLSSS